MSKSSSEAIFNLLPICIEILNSNLQITQQIYLLGDQPKAIQTTIDKEGIKSNKLNHLFEFNKSVKGGAVDWEDLDDEDFETIINSDPIIDSSLDVEESKPIEPINSVVHFNYSIDVYQEDTIFDLQKKIALVTHIEPAKQYIAIDKKCITHTIISTSDYENHTDYADLISFMQSNHTKIKGIPIDEEYTLIKYNNLITNTQANKLNTLMNGGKSITLQVISLDTIIPDKSILQFLSRSDKQSFELIFDSLIERFFISMNSALFTEYLSNHDLEFDMSQYKKVIDKQTKLITQLNKQPKVTIANKHLTITTNAITLCSDSVLFDNKLEPIISLPKLFNDFSVLDAKGVFYIDLFTTTNGRLMQVRKVSKYAAQAINFIEGISMNIKPLVANIRSYMSKDRIVITLMPSTNFSKLVISLDVFGQIEIIALSNRTTEIPKKLFIDDISHSTKHIIEYINNLSNAFISILRLDTNPHNYKIVKSTSSLIFSQRIDYDSIIKYMISDLVTADILKLDPVSNVKLKTRSFLIDSIQTNKLIRVIANSRIAMFNLVDLSIDDTEFYVDMIGRFVKYHEANVSIKVSQASGIQVADPVLFRYKSKTNTNYSRVCQKRFQPVISDKTDKKAYKYHNFTFDEPQYYKCPNKDTPFLGLLAGYHPNGYCLPCCRKQEQPNRDDMLSSCINGKSTEEQSKVPTRLNKYYIIDYPNDLISNSRLVDRISNVPDFINNMLTRGSKLLINGMSIGYSETELSMQIVNILNKFLNKSSARSIVLDILEYLKDKSNHRKVLSMPSINYSFDSIGQLSAAIADQFLKQKTIGQLQTLINWNEIIIDLSICLGIGVMILSDNRIKASDCAHTIGQAEECSDEPITTINSAINLIKLDYLNLNNPILMILRRVDTEYSKVNNNRRYFYYPIMSGLFTEPKVEAINNDTVAQLKKIKQLTEHQITVSISRGFTYQSLNASLKAIGKIKVLYTDSDNNIAYANAIIKPNRSMLVSLYRSPNIDIPSNIEIKKYKPDTYTASISDIIKLLEQHNHIQLQNADLNGFQQYLSININKLISAQEITFPSTDQCLLKLDKFIIHNNIVIGTKICAIYGRACMHTLIIYHKPTAPTEAIKLLINKTNELHKLISAGNKLSKDSAMHIAMTGLDMIHRSPVIAVYNIEQPYDKYFVEYKINPLLLIDTNPESINYPSNDTLKHAQYMSSIYKIMINAMIMHWKATRPIELIESLSQLIKSSKPDILRLMSNNLLEDWIDQLTTQYASRYHPNVISAEIYEFGNYIHSHVHTKTKESILAILSRPDLSLNDIEIHNLSYARRAQIIKMVSDAASECLVQTNAIPNKELNNNDRVFDLYRNKDGKVLILKDIYSELLDLAVSDLANPFRREYVLTNCMINSFANSVKIKSHINELIYMQEL